MRYLATFMMLYICFPAQGQYNPRKYHDFDDVKTMAYNKDLNQYTTIELNTRDDCAKGNIIGGILHIRNDCDEAIYTTMDMPVLYKGNFEIVVVVKIFCGETHDLLRDGYISWAVEGSSYTYNTFAFTNDKYYGFHSRNGKTGVCSNKLYSKRDVYYYNDFARYTIRKYGDKYYFFINGRLIGTAPYLETDGKLFELGASAKAYTEYKYIAMYYLP